MEYKIYNIMKETIYNVNNKGEFHGRVFIYHLFELYYRGNYKNGNLVVHSESHGNKRTRYNII
jgi:hypothetical protein